MFKRYLLLQFSYILQSVCFCSSISRTCFAKQKNSKYKYFYNTICKIVFKEIASIILELEL